MKLRKVNLKLSIIGIAFLIATVAICQKPGDLVVTPTRLALDSKTRAGDLTLLNRGNQPIRYRLRFIDMEMSEDGVLSRLTTKSESSGIDIFRLSPREILLQPGEYQRIKVLAVFPPGTRDGEFRSHLAFEHILMPRTTPTSTPNNQGISLNLELRSVITIPVIARNGQATASATLTNGQVETDEQGWLAKFTLGRSGNRTIRGDVLVSFVPENGGKQVTLGEISGLPVYFPNPTRKVTVRLSQDISKLGKGTIEVKFIDPDRPKGSPALRTIAAIVE